MKFKCGVTEYNFYIDVNESGIDLNETTSGLQLKLTASGRSNSESCGYQTVENFYEKTLASSFQKLFARVLFNFAVSYIQI